MKTKNYFKKAILLFLVCSAQFISAQVPNYVPTNGLVAYYPFSGNANDASGNANNGTATGATLTADRFGNANSAYNFANTGQNINFFSDGAWCANNHTISLWFNSAFISGKDQYLLAKRSSCLSGTETHNFEMRISPTNNSLDMGWGGIPTTNGAYFFNISFTPNTWNNVVYVRNGADFYVYLNGVMVATQNGNCPFPNDDYNGKLDDIGIWNRALSHQEVTNMYNQVSPYSDTCNAVSGSLTQGLVGYWPFCGNANDDSGNGNNGTVNGATLTTDRFGNSNSAYSFNGTSNFIEVPDNNLLDVSNNFTISLWMKISDYAVALSSDPQSTVLSKPKPGFSTGYCISAYYNLNNNKFSFNGVINSTQIYQTSNSAPPLNTWINVIYTYDGASSKLYKNGVLESSSNVVYSLLNSTSSLFFGKEFDNASTSKRYFKGLIDDIGIWNRALTTQEVTQLFNQNQCFTNTTVTDTLVINVGQLSYTNPISYANNITIFPNPASTQVNIAFNNISDLNGGSIKIINSLGQQVATTPITTSGTNTTMTLSTWGGFGLYFVQIVNPQGQIVDIKKILLQ